MKLLKNLLSIIGAIVVFGGLFVYVKYDIGTRMDQVEKLHPQAMDSYMEMMDGVLTTGISAEAMIRKVKINDDVSIEDVVDSLNNIAMDENFLVVGDALMSESGVDAKGNKTKYIRILSYCSPAIAKIFIDYSPSYGAFMPCRVLIVEDDNGDRWLYSMAMELMLFGGHELPPEMQEKAEHVRSTMYTMMDSAAVGDF